MEKEYMFSYRPTAINNLVSLFAILKPSDGTMKFLRGLVAGREEQQFPRLKDLLYKAMLIRRGLNQARFGDYSTFPYWVMLMYHRYRMVKSAMFRRGHAAEA